MFDVSHIELYILFASCLFHLPYVFFLFLSCNDHFNLWDGGKRLQFYQLHFKVKEISSYILYIIDKIMIEFWGGGELLISIVIWYCTFCKNSTQDSSLNKLKMSWLTTCDQTILTRFFVRKRKVSSSRAKDWTSAKKEIYPKCSIHILTLDVMWLMCIIKLFLQ